MITLLGIGHVFDIGRATRDAILSRRPKVVALELDPARYAALVQRAPRSRGFGVLHLVAGIEARVAAEDGVQVGGEMLAAAGGAHRGRGGGGGTSGAGGRGRQRRSGRRSPSSTSTPGTSSCGCGGRCRGGRRRGSSSPSSGPCSRDGSRSRPSSRGTTRMSVP